VNADAETLGAGRKADSTEVWLGLRFINDRLDFLSGNSIPPTILIAMPLPTTKRASS